MMKNDIERASNPNTPPELLAALARDANEDVRRVVAQNPNTPIHVPRAR